MSAVKVVNSVWLVIGWLVAIAWTLFWGLCIVVLGADMFSVLALVFGFVIMTAMLNMRAK